MKAAQKIQEKISRGVSAGDFAETIAILRQNLRDWEELVAEFVHLTPGECRTLHAIAAVGLRGGFSAVGEHLGVLQPAAAIAVRRLEEKNLSKRLQSGPNTDGKVALALSSRGKAVLESLQDAEMRVVMAMTKSMSTEEMNQMHAVVKRLATLPTKSIQAAIDRK